MICPNLYFTKKILDVVSTAIFYPKNSDMSAPARKIYYFYNNNYTILKRVFSSPTFHRGILSTRPRDR